MRSLRRSSSRVTVGDRPLDDFPVRMADPRNKRANAAESRDWLLVRALVQPGERSRARVAVRFPEERNASGHVFLTDQRVMFEYHEKVLSVALAYVVYLGVPRQPSLGDFVIDAMVPDGPTAGRFAITMRIRDLDAFHGFFPTLVDAVRAVGAQPEIDAGWAVSRDEPEPEPAPAPARPAVRARTPQRPAPAPAAAPGADALERALAALLEPDESVVASAEMVRNMSVESVWVWVTNRRLVVAEGSVIWASTLDRTKVVDAGGVRTHLRLLVESLDNWRAFGTGPAEVDPSAERRLVLRARTDRPACERIHELLLEHASGVLPAWPAYG